MSDNAVRVYLPVSHDQHRPLGRGARRLPRTSVADEDEAKPSAATNAHVRTYLEAWATGDEARQNEALNKVVQAWRGDNAAGGVPVHGHMPLPTSFADTLVHILRAGDETSVERTVAAADASVRPLLKQQLARVAHGGPLESGASREGWRLETPDEMAAGRHADQSSAVSGFGLEDQYRVVPPRGAPTVLFNAASDTTRGGANEGLPRRAGAVPLAAKPQPSKPTDSEDSDVLYDIAHPFAYGLDQALNDVFGKDGALGDWGKREVIPTPKNNFSRNAGNLIRHYLQIAVPLGGAAKGARFAGAIKVALEKRSVRAILGGTLSVIAEWRANGDKATGWDYGLSFVTGALTGGYEPKWGKATLDGALAFSSSVLGDILSDRPVDVPQAIVGGITASFVTKIGGWANLKESRLFSQVAGKIAKKYLEKEAREFFKAVLGDELILTGEELDRFLGVLSEHMRRQYEEFIQQGDRDPIF